jgi:hypothetical protein
MVDFGVSCRTVAARQKQALTQSEQDGLLGSLFNAEQIALVDK